MWIDICLLEILRLGPLKKIKANIIIHGKKLPKKNEEETEEKDNREKAIIYNMEQWHSIDLNTVNPNVSASAVPFHLLFGEHSSLAAANYEYFASPLEMQMESIDLGWEKRLAWPLSRCQRLQLTHIESNCEIKYFHAVDFMQR